MQLRFICQSIFIGRNKHAPIPEDCQRRLNQKGFTYFLWGTESQHLAQKNKLA